MFPDLGPRLDITINDQASKKQASGSTMSTLNKESTVCQRDSELQVKLFLKLSCRYRKANRTAYVQSPASDFQSRRARFLRRHTVPCTLC